MGEKFGLAAIVGLAIGIVFSLLVAWLDFHNGKMGSTLIYIVFAAILGGVLVFGLAAKHAYQLRRNEDRS
jgi:hypothetical protein